MERQHRIQWLIDERLGCSCKTSGRAGQLGPTSQQQLLLHNFCNEASLEDNVCQWSGPVPLSLKV